MPLKDKIKLKFYNTITASNKLFKTDMIYVVKGGFWLSLTRLVASTSTFVLAIIFANLVPKEIYGEYKYLLSLAGILTVATLSGTGTSLVQSIANGFEGSFLKVIKTKIRWGFFGSFIGLGVGTYYLIHGNLVYALVMLVAAIFIPFMESFNEYSSFLIGKRNFKLSLYYSTIIKFISLLSIATTVFFTHQLFFIVLAYFLSYTLGRLFFLLLTIKNNKLNDRQDPEVITYSKHLSVMDIIGMLAQQLDKILVFQFLGPVQLSIYSFALAGPEQVKSMLGILESLVLPKFSQGDPREIKKGMKNKIIRLFLTAALAIIGYVLIAPLFYKIFFPQYSAAVFYSQLFAFSMLNFSLAPTATYLRAKKKIKSQYINSFISPIFQIILMVLLTWKFGLLGLIIARVLSRLASSFLTFLLYLRETRHINLISEPPVVSD